MESVKYSFGKVGYSQKSREYWHGPYYLWGRRKNGHLSSKSISKENLKLYRQWINNRKKLKKLVDEMLNAGLEYATEYQDKKKTRLL